MNFDDVKDQLAEVGREIRGKIQESDLYIRVRERFQNLPATQQKSVVAGVLILTVYLVYSIPASYMSAAAELEELFAENRELTRQVIRAGALSRSLSLPPVPASGPVLVNQIDSVVNGQKVMPEQKKATTPQENVVDPKLVSKKINSEGVVTKLSNLNLRQIVHIGEDLDNIPGVRLINLQVLADQKDPHYFNVDYEVAAFSVDIAKPEPPPLENIQNKKKPRRNQDED